jgi:hypothetical protein
MAAVNEEAGQPLERLQGIEDIKIVVGNYGTYLGV